MQKQYLFTKCSISDIKYDFWRQDELKWTPNLPRSTPKRPKSTPRDFKRILKETRDTARAPQLTNKMHQERPKSTPRRASSTTRGRQTPLPETCSSMEGEARWVKSADNQKKTPKASESFIMVFCFAFTCPRSL